MRKDLRVLLILVLFAFGSSQVLSQEEQRKAIQFSGVVVTEGANGEPIPLTYTSIAVKGTSRGTVSDAFGFFSFVAQTGDTIIFSRIGYQTVEKAIPENLEFDRYSWQQIMSQDNYLLPEAVIYPWPSREHFKFDFLALDISDQLREQAEENLASQVMDELRYTIPADGRETYSLVQDMQQQTYQYSGQFKPQNIFNPVAWKQFIEAWRRGDFKKKKKKK